MSGWVKVKKALQKNGYKIPPKAYFKRRKRRRQLQQRGADAASRQPETSRTTGSDTPRAVRSAIAPTQRRYMSISMYAFQQKLKEEREAKRNQLDDRHAYILKTVADSLGVDYSEVEDAILEGTQVGVDTGGWGIGVRVLYGYIVLYNWFKLSKIGFHSDHLL